MAVSCRFWLLLALLIPGLPALAQMSPQWGSGQWGAMQGCGVQSAPGAMMGGGPAQAGGGNGRGKVDASLQAAQKRLREKQNQLKKTDRELERARRDVEDAISPNFSDVLFEHIESGRSCQAYKGVGEAGEGIACEKDQVCTQESGLVDIRVYQLSEWRGLCPANLAGAVNGGAACALSRSRAVTSRGGAGRCGQGLQTYARKYAEKRRLERDIENLERDIEDRQEDLQAAAEDRSTEGGFCLECAMGRPASSGPQTNWAGVLSNGLVGGLAVYLGYQQNKMISQNNAALGWPTQPQYPAWGYGLPYVQNALYGALGGGTGAGGFGCAGGAGIGVNMNPMMGGGVFGYPAGMMSGGMMGLNTGLTGYSPMAMSYPSLTLNSSLLGYGTTGYGTGYGLTSGLQGYNPNLQYQMQATNQLQTQMNSLQLRLQQLQSGATGYLGVSPTLTPVITTGGYISR
ncbi:MAG: hypothetical protein KF865_14345 [Bdellovibrionaceae bacterium]|nr:hypothetical protein [Pseudobdellovibrionaceae bacterium]